MAERSAGDIWVKRVLGIAIAPPESAGDSGGAALQAWQSAKEAVDARLNKLYGRLRKTGEPVLIEISGEIENVFAQYRVRLVAALLEWQRASGGDKAKAGQAALKVVADYESGLAGDKHVAAADANPFGVEIGARATLGQALAQVRRLLAA